MNRKAVFLPLGLLFLGACASEISAPVAPAPDPAQQMFDTVVAMAGPNQNPQTARLRADGNCYWYTHVGPVEATELPLLTPDGRHICAPAPVEPVV